MVKGDNIVIFDFLDKDEILSHVEANYTTGEVKCVEYTKDIYNQVFGEQEHTIDNLNDFFEERVFSKNRPDLDLLCELVGVNGFNPLDICKATHGKMWFETLWIRFKGEEHLTWDSVRKLDQDRLEERVANMN